MGDEKISSDAVPAKFAEWLLAMGCPAEQVPSVDKVAEMCRGQYYMVWRSLMEHVEPKDVVRHKRLQVFCDDMRKCQKKNVLHEHDPGTVVPEQLTVWRQQAELKQKLASAKTRVELARGDLDQLLEKISSKMAQRNLSRRRLEDLQRRAWLLQQVAEELRSKQVNLRETNNIAHSLCSIDENGDIQSKLDKCLLSLRRQTSQQTAAPTPAANSTVTANDSDFEDQLSALVKCRGDALCSQLYERRAGLVAALSNVDITKKTPESPSNKVSPQRVLSHTAALHCTLALEATKNRVHLKQAHKRLVAAVSELNNYLSGESCELLVVRCEKAHAQARVEALRAQLDELAAHRGVFCAGGDAPPPHRGSVAGYDRDIESKRDELKAVITSLAATERKIQSVKECLATVFNGFHKDLPHDDSGKFRGMQVEIPQESICSIRQFYEARRDRRRSKLDISLDLEVSDCLLIDTIDINNPRYIDELRIYLKKFNLEKNRKLVLESGEKIWIFETFDCSVMRLYNKWLPAEMPCALLCPSDSLGNNLRQLLQDERTRATLEAMVRLDGGRNVKDIDIKTQTAEEEVITDRIKKRLKDGLVCLAKTRKTLDLGSENLRFWADNNMRKHISQNRTINGMTYKDYEVHYLDSCIN